MSNRKLTVLPGSAYPLGVFGNGNDLEVSACYRGTNKCGIAFFKGTRNKEPEIVLFDESCRTGRLYSAVIKNAKDRYDSYLLYEDGQLFVDPYARKIIGLEQFGVSVDAEALRCKSVLPSYDWRGDIRPQIPYEDSFLYCLNVRAFTKQDPSIKERSLRGTFKALTEKIPYLQSLGVTAIELMPIHEIHTALSDAHPERPDAIYLDNGTIVTGEQETVRPNLWGYQDGYYFAPRASYSADKVYPCNELKDMIRAFHNAHMEVLLQFYFAQGVSQNLMVDCIRYWVSEYHIDGFHLKSDNIPVDIIASDPMLHDLKIMSANPFALKRGAAGTPLYLAAYGGDFTWRARRFLKGDDLTASDMADIMYLQSPEYASVHFICNYDGFTLRDLVTYEHKRNDANGEGGADGRNDNFTWNCGVEGETRKRNVRALRMRQMLNAVTFVMLTRGTPLLHAGDECGNTQEGNNNPYCQDNRIGWTTWDKADRFKALTDYIAFLSRLRASCRVLRKASAMEQNLLSRPYPDLSFHGAEAWKPDFSDTSHSFGVLYGDTKEDVYLYVAFNMYWEKTSFALPALPSHLEWAMLSDTGREDAVLAVPERIKGQETEATARSIRIFQAVVAAQKAKQKNKTNGKKETT